MRILVIGGSGFLGQHIIAKLAVRGDKMTVPTRRLAHARELLVFPTVTVQTGDIHDDQKLNEWVRDHDVVINLVGVLHSRPSQPYGPDFEHAHVTLPARIAKACVVQGVKQFIHISALGADVKGPSGYQRSKAAGEAAIWAACKGHDDLCVTVFRPSVVFGPGDKFMNMFAKLARFFPVLPMAGSKTRMQPIYVGDVAQAVINTLGNNHLCGQTFDLAGPHVYTLGELVKLASKWSGNERSVIDLPVSVGRLQAAFFELLPGEPLMSRDNLDSLKVDNVSEQPISPLLGILPTALEAIAPMYLKKGS
jgi:uncharacterized protein YbjT (DUF2867 family)